mmetsp:Transcript_3799/g.4340  ORF Transcript_3799/g.4340 Transcript_3799/m.4340 type:complete len:358 (+) Transcript_3799:65-1138(+)
MYRKVRMWIVSFPLHCTFIFMKTSRAWDGSLIVTPLFANLTHNHHRSSLHQKLTNYNMKIYGSILSLLAVQNANGFSIQAPKANGSALNAQSYSYLGGNQSDPKAPSAPGAPSITGKTGPSSLYKSKSSTKELMSKATPVRIQGDTLKTCAIDEGIDIVEVLMSTEGRPLNADVDLWQGPDNTPQKMTVYLEDGALRPMRVIFSAPGSGNTVSIRNTGQVEFPLTACMEPASSSDNVKSNLEASKSRIVQGGAVFTIPFEPKVQSVQLMLKTDGRPMSVRVELLQGPNNVKQVMEVYCEDGAMRPFCAVLDTPGTGNVIRICNIATIEYPLNASLEPYIIDENIGNSPGQPNGMTWR